VFACSTHAHPRRPVLRPHAGCLWRRRDARQFASPAQHRSHRRHQPRQALGLATCAPRLAARRCAMCCARPTSSSKLSAGQLGGARLRARSDCAGAARHRDGLALGLWRDRAVAGKRGFDSLVQTATGFNHAKHRQQRCPSRALPMQILDMASGALMAFGAQAALLRQQREAQLACSRVAGAHRLVAARTRRVTDASTRRLPTSPGSWRRASRLGELARSATPPSSRTRRPAMRGLDAPGSHPLVCPLTELAARARLPRASVPESRPPVFHPSPRP